MSQMADLPLRRAVFLDRDKTLNEDPGYISHPDKLFLLPGVGEGLRQLHDAGYLLVVISNQSGVGRGYYTEEDLSAVHARLLALLSAQGVLLDGAYYCMHTPADQCACRKPEPGMILQAARELGIDLAQSVMVGDKVSDVEAGRRAGCATVLIAPEPPAAPVPAADVALPDLPALAAWLLGKPVEV